jgi:negative regulator of sigma E activity
MWPKTLVIMAVVAGVLAAVAIGLFAFGAPTSPQVSPSAALAIQVPGCVCHSDDPQVVADHATYRMSQCFDCHRDGTAAMGR